MEEEHHWQLLLWDKETINGKKFLGILLLLLVFSGGLMAVFLIKKPLLYMFSASDYTIEYATVYNSISSGNSFVELAFRIRLSAVRDMQERYDFSINQCNS